MTSLYKRTLVYKPLLWSLFQALDDALDEALDGLASSGWSNQRETAIGGANKEEGETSGGTDKK